ncbi:hypothetical protein K1T71_008878 [Dendrolimus kikuchii]|uniref:Uncharacterized protein n=1 Tax=Dendrolimus kikuchii TaxID=765133 RepID=A0ACC1CW59_9NEOP|nr:hypothetical protein K1T71_008878 [Dendrolimus kikuchii]
MFKIFFLIFAALVACRGNPTPKEIEEPRNGNFNTYYGYNKNSPFQAIQISNMNPSELVAMSFVPSQPTVIIIHGHGGTAFTTLNPLIKDAYFSNKDDEEVNVIVVDWSVYASQNYNHAVNAVSSVGEHLAVFIRRVLVPFNQFSLSNLHLVGFNLGAHVAGFAGRQFPGQIGRITGLDPSGSQWGSNSGHLTRNDALYVEVIHTDGSGLNSNGFGNALGHVDFFVNGGSNQPGCFTSSCSHNRAFEVFAASLTHGNLFGNLCNTNLQLTLNTCRGATLEMGTNRLIKFGRGIYRANTGRSYPF